MKTENNSCSQEYTQQDYRQKLKFNKKQWEALVHERSKRAPELDREHYRPLKNAIEALPANGAGWADYTGDVVSIGKKNELSKAAHQQLVSGLKAFIPWRKGPFDYYGHYIDSEWQSNLKWDRVKEYAGLLENKVVADIGCSNMYYMYRMLEYNPRLVVGFEPVARYYFNYRFNQKLTQRDDLAFEYMGVEQLPLFKKKFDVVFLMGILYHRRSPVDCLDAVNAALKQKGVLILESAGIPGSDEICLFPAGRYMKAPGFWFLPTVSALENMLARTGFHNIRTFYNEPQAMREQRKTPWIRALSFEDFIDPDDPSKTVEGYPAPARICTYAEKKRL